MAFKRAPTCEPQILDAFENAVHERDLSSANDKQDAQAKLKKLSFRVEALEHALSQVHQLASRDSELFGANRQDIVERINEILNKKG